MIGQPDVQAPAWGNLKRDLTIADLKANAVNGSAKKAPFQTLKESGGVVTDAAPDQQTTPPPHVPTMQTVLMLYQPRTRYALTPKHEMPALHSDDEVLIKVKAIGLNPIDWKGPDFGFGIPTLPYINGRDFVGTIVHAHPSSPLHPRSIAASSASSIPSSSASSTTTTTTSSPLDTDAHQPPLYLAISTDYRDPRKSAFQQYAVAQPHTICRLPRALPAASGASLGAPFVAAALTLGICFGIDFSSPSPSTTTPSNVPGPNYRALLRAVPASRIPPDCLAEAHGANIADDERARAGDWLVLWGGSSATARCAARLARGMCAGMRVVAVGDVAKHGRRWARDGGGDVDLWVDSHDPERAAEVVRAVVGGGSGRRFGVDFVGRETAGRLARALDGGGGAGQSKAHLVGLASGPKDVGEGVRVHSVPIKLFHEVPEVGRATVAWLERLLEEGLLTPPEVVVEKGGLAAVNGALDRMRRGEISGQRLAVELD
ncbi:hypothetical protein SLS58_011222 [Diplodia intermedia]|uniref:Alcohol dehydrogenase-like N-terminal domain-containing protein n=1 Tax=Diplodia intermedia TaxID=856260 RepID=A0ABR3T0K0_9PEZI